MGRTDSGYGNHSTLLFGRKRASLVSLLWASTTGFLMAFAPSIAWFNVLRFLTAVGTSGYADVAHILILESVSPDKRYIVTMTVGIGWSIGMILVPIQAHFLPNWRSMLIGVPLPVLLLLVLWFCMDESARWLIGAGRYTEARQALLRLTHSRGDLEDRHVDELLDAIKLQHQQGELKTKPTIADLFSREYRKSTIIFCATMLVSYLLWYHVTVSTAGVGTNPYIAFATAATFELPGKAMNVLFIRFVRRRRAATLAFGVASVLTAAYGVLPVGLAWLRLGCLIMCKLCIAVQGAVHRVQISELYPSVIRALSTGFIITIGSFGSVLAPFLDDVGYLTFEWVPMVFIALLCSLSCVAVLSLPETFEDVLQDGMTSNSSQPRSRGQSTGSPTPTAISASHSKPPDGQNERLRSLSGTDNKAMELSG